MIPSVFLSHNWQDKDFARKLASDLGSHGIYVWIDEAEIQIGDSLIDKIRKGIDVVDYLLVVLSPDSVNSEWVKKEVDIAMNQEINKKQVKVLPIMYRRCELPWFLEGKLYADFTRIENYETSLGKLLDKLGVKENLFRVQGSIFQKIETILYPLIKEVDEILSADFSQGNYEWTHGGPIPDKTTLKVFESLKSKYLQIKPQAIDLLILSSEHLSVFTQMAEIYNEILTQREEKMRYASLLEFEAGSRVRTRAYEDMGIRNKKLYALHHEYSDMAKELKRSLTKEKLWSAETILELESKLDAIYLRALRISEFDKVINW